MTIVSCPHCETETSVAVAGTYTCPTCTNLFNFGEKFTVAKKSVKRNVNFNPTIKLKWIVWAVFIFIAIGLAFQYSDSDKMSDVLLRQEFEERGMDYDKYKLD